MRNGRNGRTPSAIDPSITTLSIVRQHLLEGLEVQPLASHLGSAAVLLQDAQEALAVAAGQQDPLLAEGGRALDDLSCLASRPRQDVLAVGLSLVDRPLAVLARPDDLVEGVSDLVGRVGDLESNVGDEDARVCRRRGAGP